MNLTLCSVFLVARGLCDPFWMFRFSQTVVFLVRICVVATCSETENLTFCNIEIYNNATNVLLTEKNLRLMRFMLLKNI